MVVWRKKRLGNIAIASIMLLSLSTHYQTQKPTGEEEKSERLACGVTILPQADISHSDPEDPELSWFQSDVPLTSVGIWTDLPNAFPWRHCLQEYNNLLIPLSCDPTLATQTFTLESLNNNTKQFHWKTAQGYCVVPGQVVHEGRYKNSLTFDRYCGCGYWTWTRAGQFRWSEGDQKCVQTFKINTPVELVTCRDLAEDQNLELGRWVETPERRKLTPLSLPAWKARQDNMRDAFLAPERPAMRRVVEEVEMDDLHHQHDKVEEGKRRRAAVFYLDQGSSALAMVRCQALYSLHFIEEMK